VYEVAEYNANGDRTVVSRIHRLAGASACRMACRMARVRNRHGLSIFKVESLDRDEAARAAYYLWRI